MYGLQMRGDDSLSSVIDDGHWKRATMITYQTVSLFSVSKLIGEWRNAQILGQNACHM